MSADVLLQRLDGVQRQGKGWRAKCPSCGGASRKLSISEADEGRVLLHCFGGCSAADVVQAAGLQLVDLFPERLTADTPDDRRKRRRAARESQWGAALDTLALETRIVALAAAAMVEGNPLSAEDRDRLARAALRIEDAESVLRDKPRWKPQVAAA